MRAHLLMDVPLTALGLAAWPAYGPAPLLGLAGAASLIHAWGVLDPRSSLYLPVHWRLPRDQQGLALSFDDGPHPEATPRLLDLLAEAGQQATFFLIGVHVRQHGALLRRMHTEGHALALHSDTHSRWFNCWPPGRVRRDLEACAAAIADATGTPPPRLFRPPVGLKNPIVGHVAGQLGLCCLTWSARAADAGTTSAEAILARLRPRIRPRAIICLHDGCEPWRSRDRHQTLRAVETLLPLLAAAKLPSRALAVDGQRPVLVGKTPTLPCS